MKTKKLLASLLAGAIAVSSLSVAAFAKTDESSTTTTFTGKIDTEGLTLTANPQEVKQEDGSAITLATGDKVDITVKTAPSGTTFSITVNAETPATVADGDTAATSVNITAASDGQNLQLKTTTTGASVVVASVTVTRTTSTPAPGGDPVQPEEPEESEPTVAPAPVVVTTAADSVVTANAEEAEAIPEDAKLNVAPKAEKDASAIKAIDTAAAPEAVKEVLASAQALVEKGEAAVVDISLVVEGKETQPTGEVTVSVEVPKFIKEQNKFFNKTFYLYRVEKDGTLTDMKATYNRSERKLQFKTTHFSTYIITLEAIETASAAETTAAETTAAETTAAEATAAETTAAEAATNPDDKNQATGVMFAIIPAVIAAAGVVVSKKRK